MATLLPGGWQTEPRKLRKIKFEDFDVDTDGSFGHAPEEAARRTPLSALAPDNVLMGRVVGHWLFHGLQVGGWVDRVVVAWEGKGAQQT